MNTYKFNTNINCGNCINAVTPFLNEVDNVDHWEVDTDNPDKVLTVVLDDTDTDAVIDAVQKAGYTISARS